MAGIREIFRDFIGQNCISTRRASQYALYYVITVCSILCHHSMLYIMSSQYALYYVITVCSILCHHSMLYIMSSQYALYYVCASQYALYSVCASQYALYYVCASQYALYYVCITVCSILCLRDVEIHTLMLVSVL